MTCNAISNRLTGFVIEDATEIQCRLRRCPNSYAHMEIHWWETLFRVKDCPGIMAPGADVSMTDSPPGDSIIGE